MEKFYTIIAGRKEPVTVEYGTLNKKTGLPNPNVEKGMITVGKILVLNYSRVWARRVAEPSDPKVTVEGRVTVGDPNYKGKLEFLKWGEEGGEVVEVRYLPHSHSLDKQYQDNVQKLVINDERDIYIRLDQGMNDFDYRTQSLLIEFLKVHSYNQSSKSRDVSMTDYDFEEYSPTAKAVTREIGILTYNDATGIVMNAKGNIGRLKILAELFGEESRLQDEVLFERLLDKAEKESPYFMEVIMNYKNALHLQLNDALEIELIAFNKGVLEIKKNGKWIPIIKGLNADSSISTLVSRAMDGEVYDAYLQVQSALTAYRVSLT